MEVGRGAHLTRSRAAETASGLLRPHEDHAQPPRLATSSGPAGAPCAVAAHPVVAGVEGRATDGADGAFLASGFLVIVGAACKRTSKLRTLPNDDLDARLVGHSGEAKVHGVGEAAWRSEDTNVK
jgi:hypothetical protein